MIVEIKYFLLYQAFKLESNHLNLRDLAVKIGIDYPNFHHNLKILEREGYLERYKCGNKFVRVKLLSKAHNFLNTPLINIYLTRKHKNK